MNCSSHDFQRESLPCRTIALFKGSKKMTKTSIGPTVRRLGTLEAEPNPSHQRLVRKLKRTKNPNSNGRIAAAFQAELSPDDLTGSEQDVWMNEVNKKIAAPSKRELQFFKERRRFGIVVGLDETGKIFHQKPGS